MLCKTGGIVFKFIKYRETSVIATVFTESFGTQTYLVNNVRTKKPTIAIALFQPLTLLEMVVYHKENANMNRVSEIKCSDPFSSIPYNMQKSAIALFISEILYKAIRHESHPSELFHFIKASLLSFDNLGDNFENFHLQFLLKLTRYLGFYPESAIELQEQLIPGNLDSSEELDSFLINNYGKNVKITNEQRRNFLRSIIDYYRLHIESMGNINSYNILHEVIGK